MVYDRSRFLVSHRKDCQAISASFIVIVIRLSFLVGGLLPINIVQFCSIFVQRLGAVGGSYNPAHALYIRFIAILCLFTPLLIEKPSSLTVFLQNKILKQQLKPRASVSLRDLTESRVLEMGKLSFSR